MIWLIKQLLHIRNVFRSGDTPRQLAFGVGLGVMLGLVMNGNLLAIGLTILVCATRANLSMVALTTLCVGFLAHFADPITHRIGYAVLTLPALQGTFEQLYQLPLAAWTDFNHTVVMGSFLLGVALVYPTYRVTLPFFRRWKRQETNSERHASKPDTLTTDKRNDQKKNARVSDKDDCTAHTPPTPCSSSDSGSAPTANSKVLRDATQEISQHRHGQITADHLAEHEPTTSDTWSPKQADAVAPQALPEDVDTAGTLVSKPIQEAKPEPSDSASPATKPDLLEDSSADESQLRERQPEMVASPKTTKQTEAGPFARVMRSRMATWQTDSLNTADTAENREHELRTAEDAAPAAGETDETSNQSATAAEVPEQITKVPEQITPASHTGDDPADANTTGNQSDHPSQQASAGAAPQIPSVADIHAFREIPKSNYGFQAGAD